jgi:hypothetical protein
MRARVESERQRRAEGERGVLAPVIVERRVAHFDGAVRDRIEHLQARHDFAGGERLDLEFVVGDIGNALAEKFAAAIKRIERLRPACGEAPLDFRIRLRDRGRCDHSTRRETDATCLQEITTFHSIPSVVPNASATNAILMSLLFRRRSASVLLSETWCSKTVLGPARYRTAEIPDRRQDGQSVPGNQGRIKLDQGVLAKG